MSATRNAPKDGGFRAVKLNICLTGDFMKTKIEIEKKLAEETAKEKKLATDQDATDCEVESQLATVDTLRWVLGFCG